MRHTVGGKAGRGRKGLRGAALLLALVLLVLLAVPAPVSRADSADTARKIEEAMAEQAANQERLDEIAAQAAQMAGTVNQYYGDLAWLNSKNEEQVALYQTLLAEQNAALQEAAEALDAYLASEADLAAREAKYRERLQVMFEYREKPVLEVLLESGSLQGFFSNMELIRAVADYDRQVIDELEAARDDADLKHENALRKQKDAEALVLLKQADIDALKGEIQRNQDALAEAEAVLQARREDEDAMLAQSDEIAELINELQTQYDSEKAAEEEEARRRAYSGTMLWPVPSSRWLTSPFQPDGRTDLPGQTRPHTGVDIGADYGTPIISVAAGTVMVVYNPWEGQNTGGYGYGNYIVVNHGNGLVTLYGHLKNVQVEQDQWVGAGDVIALMGSTGNSTGPHLHFEVRVGGYPVEPLQSQYIGQP
ncbi:MAG: peptidoglycan DD-metalloendopeptidase family protein [Clostridia bacterium]|nr:peptidoglycan DD-metalloendopeptidase family protein [Clostridia bacterium]